MLGGIGGGGGGSFHAQMLTREFPMTAEARSGFSASSSQEPLGKFCAPACS